MFDLSKIVSGMVSPKLALSLLAKNVMETVGHEVDQYVMQMDISKKLVLFDIVYPERLGTPPEKYQNPERKHRYKLDDAETLIKMFSATVSTKIEKGTSIDFIFLDYNDLGEIKVTVAYKNSQNEKLKKTIIL